MEQGQGRIESERRIREDSCAGREEIKLGRVKMGDNAKWTGLAEQKTRRLIAVGPEEAKPRDIVKCGDLSRLGPWGMNASISRCSLVGVSMALLMDVCHCWGGL